MRKSAIKKSSSAIRDSHTFESRLSVNSIDKTVVSDVAEPEDTTQIAIWHKRMMENYDSGSYEEESQPIGFLFRLEEVAGISHRKKQPNSRLYGKLTAGLYNLQLKQYYVRTYQSAALLLQQTKNRKDEYELTEHIALFFFSYESMHDSLELRLELQVVECGKSQNILTSGYVGGWVVNPFGKARGQTREQLKPNLFAEAAPVANTIALFTIGNNESIRPLFRLIPPHCVCGGEDNLPGLVGNRLPHASSYLRIEYTLTYMLKMQLSGLELPDSVSIEAVRNAQKYFEARTKFAMKQVKTKKIQLKLSYHNGWKTVSTACLELIEKKQMEVRNKSTIYKGTMYEGRQITVLPMVFLEPGTVLSIELTYELEGVHEGGVQSLSYAAACYELCLLEIRDNIKHYKCLLSSGPYQSISNQLPILSTTSPIKIQFDLHLSLSDQAPQKTAQSSLEMPEFDRMDIEKSRVIQEKKKIKWERRKLQMEYADAPRMLDVNEVIEQTYIEKLNQVQRERDANREILEQLRRKLDQYNIQEGEQEATSEQEEEEHFVGSQGVYYKTLMQPSEAAKLPSQIPCVLTASADLPSAAIIRTELMECSYASWFIFNFLSLTTQSHRLPRKFSVVVNFFTEAELQTRLMEPSLTTGQLHHCEYDDKNPNDKHPVYTIKVQPNAYRPREHYLNLLAYMQSNKLQLTILDETNMEFGYVLVPIHGLLRRRRQEVKQTIEAEVFYRDTIKGNFKVEITNMRQQPTHPSVYEEKVNSKAVSPRKDKLDVIIASPNKQIGDSIVVPLNPTQKVEVTGDQRLKQRIERFKNSVKQGSSIKKPQPTPLEAQQQNRESNRNQLINRIVQERIVVEKTICPIYMLPEVFFLEFSNPEQGQCEYNIAVLDPDNEIFNGHELELVMQASQALSWLQEKYLEGYQQSTIKDIDPTNTFSLQKGEKITLVFRYTSQRQFTKINLTDRASQVRFNRERSLSINISTSDFVAALYRISIKPQPNVCNLELCYYSGQNQNTTLVLPPLLPADEHRNLNMEWTLPQLTLQWMQNNQAAITLQTPSLDDLLSELKFNILVFEGEPSSRVISIWRVRVISCEKIVANGKLGTESEMLVRLDKSVCPNNQPLLVHSEDDKVVKPSAISKLADGGISFRLKILPNFTNSRTFHLRVLNSQTREAQREMVVEVNSEQPNYKSTFKVEHKHSVPRRQEQFEYVNPLPKKTQFTVTSTDPYLIRPEEPKFEVAANKPKQFKLSIFSPAGKMDYAEVTLIFTDRDEQMREFFLFKLTYLP